MTLVKINEFLLKTLQYGRDMVKNLCQKKLPYFGQLKRVLKELKEGYEKESILQFLLGWAKGEIEGEILHWKELATSFIKEFHKVKNCDYKNKSICQTIIIMSSLQFEFLCLFQPNLQFLT